jgi:hypothetical protein
VRLVGCALLLVVATVLHALLYIRSRARRGRTFDGFTGKRCIGSVCVRLRGVSGRAEGSRRGKCFRGNTALVFIIDGCNFSDDDCGGNVDYLFSQEVEVRMPFPDCEKSMLLE